MGNPYQQQPQQQWPGPPPPQHQQGYGGPPPPQQHGYGGGGYNPGYGAPPPMPHQGQYNQYGPAGNAYMPPSAGGSQPSFGAPPGPPQTHYGAKAPGMGPPQYQGGQFGYHARPNDNFHYSNCSGKRKALLIGINYTGTSAALRGCHNDVLNLQRFLIERYRFKPDDMVVLTDRPGSGPMDLPTRANIARAMGWLVAGAAPNDSLVFHFSGHGGQMKDRDGDEADGYDETIYPLDYKQAGQITDDEIHDRLVRPLPRSCRLTGIFDSCHSGSALDLPYTYSTEGKIKEPNALADLGQGAMSAVTGYLRGDIGGIFKTVTSTGKKIMNGDKADRITKQTKSSDADVISISGCKDSQTSADASAGGLAGGAMSMALIATLTKYPQVTYLQFLNLLRDEIKKYSQKPQLSTAHEWDLQTPFVM